jgi:cellulose synthase/poly-beta-1,6-N-acetylglucosamine synthase-like glycosyltransferase
MAAISMNELPAPPAGKTGWPWTEECPRLPDRMQGGQIWPRISIVTPSFNQEDFIEETIRAILLQGYPNLEYIISEDCSTDDTLEIVRKYEKWLTVLVADRNGLSPTSGGVTGVVDTGICASLYAEMNMSLLSAIPRAGLFIDALDAGAMVTRVDSVTPGDTLYLPQYTPSAEPRAFLLPDLLQFNN